MPQLDPSKQLIDCVLYTRLASFWRIDGEPVGSSRVIFRLSPYRYLTGWCGTVVAVLILTVWTAQRER